MKSTLDIVKAGLLKVQADHAEVEEGKAGDLRVGNSGTILPDGSVLGKCARLTYLRFIGVESEGDSYSKEFMFAAGRTNEDSWVEMLVNGGIPEENILREEAIPVEWSLPSGVKITGRPDIVIGEWVEKLILPDVAEVNPGLPDIWDSVGLEYTGGNQPQLKREFIPKKVLELKLVCSIWQARRVAFQDQPQADHLMQASHYLWKLGEQTGTEGALKGELWYTSRVNYPIAYGKQQSMFPKQGEPGSECIQYGDDGNAFSTIPFIVGYEIKWNAEGTLEYRKLGERVGMWRETLITKEGIERYYRTVSEMSVTKELPPRPLKANALGEKMSSSACSYCALKNVCDKREKDGLDVWVEEVKKWVPQLPQTGSLNIEKNKDK